MDLVWSWLYKPFAVIPVFEFSLLLTTGNYFHMKNFFREKSDISTKSTFSESLTKTRIFEKSDLNDLAVSLLILGNNVGLPVSISIAAVFFAFQYAQINPIKKVRILRAEDECLWVYHAVCIVVVCNIICCNNFDSNTLWHVGIRLISKAPKSQQKPPWKFW